MNFSKTEILHSRFLEAPKFEKHYHSFLLQSHFLPLPLNASPVPLLSTTHMPSSRKNCRCWRHRRRVIESETSIGSTQDAAAVLSAEEQEEQSAKEIVVVESDQREEVLADENLWSQMVEIVNFSGPAVGLWLCGPLMSLIDSAVIGQGSSVELAALGPGTVFIDYTSYVFMFLSIATSNLIATSLARQDTDEVQHQISNLLFIGLACGVFMLVFSRLFGPLVLTAFIGAKNTDIIAASNTYVQIRCLAWPAILIGWVAQSSRCQAFLLS